MTSLHFGLYTNGVTLTGLDYAPGLDCAPGLDHAPGLDCSPGLDCAPGLDYAPISLIFSKANCMLN